MTRAKWEQLEIPGVTELIPEKKDHGFRILLLDEYGREIFEREDE